MVILHWLMKASQRSFWHLAICPACDAEALASPAWQRCRMWAVVPPCERYFSLFFHSTTTTTTTPAISIILKNNFYKIVFRWLPQPCCWPTWMIPCCSSQRKHPAHGSLTRFLMRLQLQHSSTVLGVCHHNKPSWRAALLKYSKQLLAFHWAHNLPMVLFEEQYLYRVPHQELSECIHFSVCGNYTDGQVIHAISTKTPLWRMLSL